MFQRFAESARVAVFFARYEALAAGAACIQPDHFKVALLHLYPAMASIAPLGPWLVPASPRGRDDVPLSESSKRVLRSAADQARDIWRRETGWVGGMRALFRREQWVVDARHILVALMDERDVDIQDVRTRLFGHGAIAPMPRMPAGLSPTARYTSKLGVALLCAQYESARLVSGSVRPEHLLLGLVFASVHLRKPQAAEGLFGPIAAVRQAVDAFCPPAAAVPGKPDPHAVQALAHAVEEADALGHRIVGTGHLMLGLLRSDCPLPKEYLHRRGVELTTARGSLSKPDLL